MTEIIKDKTYSINKKGLLIFANTLFVLYFVLHLFNITYLEGMVVGFICVILPGLGWTLLLQSRIKDSIIQLITSVFITTIFWIIGLLFIKLIGGTVDRLIFIIYLFVITNSGYIVLRKDTHLSISKYYIFILIIVIPLLAMNAMLMPVVDDADAPLTVPAYGLIHELIPYSDLWGQQYEFHHPPWSSLLSSFSIFLMGDLYKIENNYRRAKGLIIYEREDTYEDATIMLHQDRKLLFSSRIPHCVLAGLLLLILFEIVKNQTQSTYWGLFSVFFILNPEIIVRFSHAFYIVPSFFILLSMCYSYLYVTVQNGIPFFFGFCAAWINQKNVIVPLAVLCADFFRLKGKLNIHSFQLLFGFIIGYLFLCIYGASVDWHFFYNAIVIGHGIDGLIMHSDIIGFLTAWTRAILFFNPILFILSLIAIVHMTRKSFNTRLFVIPCWFYIGFLIFVACRWPHIKNCSYVYLPLVMSLAYFIHNQKRMLKRSLLWVLIIVYCFNLFLLGETIWSPSSYYACNDDGNILKEPIVAYSWVWKEKFK